MRKMLISMRCTRHGNELDKQILPFITTLFIDELMPCYCINL